MMCQKGEKISNTSQHLGDFDSFFVHFVIDDDYFLLLIIYTYI